MSTRVNQSLEQEREKRDAQRSHPQHRKGAQRNPHIHSQTDMYYQSINQSKSLTEPHTGKEKPIPALPQGAANLASRSDTDLEGLKSSILAARVYLL